MEDTCPICGPLYVKPIEDLTVSELQNMCDRHYRDASDQLIWLEQKFPSRYAESAYAKTISALGSAATP